MPRFDLRARYKSLGWKSKGLQVSVREWWSTDRSTAGGLWWWKGKCGVLANKANEVELVPDFHDLVWHSVANLDVWELVSTEKK